MKNIQVIAIIKVDINHETETLQHLNILVDKTRKEKGCLQYNLVKDYNRQNKMSKISKQNVQKKEKRPS